MHPFKALQVYIQMSHIAITKTLTNSVVYLEVILQSINVRVSFFPVITPGGYHRKSIKQKKLFIFTLCNTVGHRHYQNWAHIKQALIPVMPSASGISLHKISLVCFHDQEQI
jgi:hypothetical protein